MPVPDKAYAGATIHSGKINWRSRAPISLKKRQQRNTEWPQARQIFEALVVLKRENLTPHAAILISTVGALCADLLRTVTILLGCHFQLLLENVVKPADRTKAGFNGKNQKTQKTAENGHPSIAAQKTDIHRLQKPP